MEPTPTLVEPLLESSLGKKRFCATKGQLFAASSLPCAAALLVLLSMSGISVFFPAQHYGATTVWESAVTGVPICSNGFPSSFAWGVGTAAYQIEGGVNESGRTPSIWDKFSHTPGKTFGGDTGDVACDHFHRWQEDVVLMQSIGLRHYRFSLSWSRVMTYSAEKQSMIPNGEGLAFYSGLLDALHAAGITAHVTLYHWDLPLALHKKHGGWHIPDNEYMHAQFELYARLCFTTFGDRVATWFTFNEPWSFTVSGYSLGNHAPGCAPAQESGPCSNGDTVPYIVAHNVLNSHARASAAYRKDFQPVQKGRISITLNCEMSLPLTDSAADSAAAERALQFWLGWWLFPILYGEYPPAMVANVGSRLPTFSTAQQKLLMGSIDLIGINHYSTHLVRALGNGERGDAGSGWEADQHVSTSFGEGWPAAASPWQKSYPEGIRGLLNWVHDHYQGEIYITENGWSCNTFTAADAAADLQQEKYFKDYTEQVRRALILDGIPVAGYFAWSLYDNFEWADGYSKRFGLFFVDYKTQRRSPKAAVTWWKETTSKC